MLSLIELYEKQTDRLEHYEKAIETYFNLFVLGLTHTMGCQTSRSEEKRICDALQKRFFDARRNYQTQLRESAYCSDPMTRRSALEFFAKAEHDAMHDWMRHARPVAVVVPINDASVHEI